MISCSCDEEYYFSKTIDDGIYVEVYVCPGGAHASGTYYYYITDSLNFKKFVGDCDDHEYINVEKRKSNIYVERICYKNDEKEILDSVSYKISSILNDGDYTRWFSFACVSHITTAT